jgi:UDP-3-O-[3-hydroxymyristoyl] N-acetylglucosamine deacetylase
MVAHQQTIAKSFSLSGVGLHSGDRTTVKVSPAEASAGRFFVYQEHLIPAQIAAVAATVMSTELKVETAAVRTVEHLLAALSGMGVDNARIEVDLPELPILDGSALPWVEAIAQAGIQPQSALRRVVTLAQIVTVQHGDGFVAAFPSDRLRFSYGIEFPTRAIGTQWFSWQPEDFAVEFAREIAPARTFTLARDVEKLRAHGLIKGGSLENALVCDDNGWLNPPLRFADEPCRHKLLDLIGDLSLLGFLPQAHIVAFKASHTLHTQFAHALQLVVNV